ncbi:AAA family ATPase [Parafrankia sp. FMc2]|uniref:nSTAND1 domain-containing NTPase n=1 Tax=Parafrankia sp. FMc2 TaxID=3233196 RepID=UPI0034D3D1F5
MGEGGGAARLAVVRVGDQNCRAGCGAGGAGAGAGSGVDGGTASGSGAGGGDAAGFAADAARLVLPEGYRTTVVDSTAAVDVADSLARVAAEAIETFGIYWHGPLRLADDGSPEFVVGSTALTLAHLLALISAAPAPRRFLVVGGHVAVGGRLGRQTGPVRGTREIPAGESAGGVAAERLLAAVTMLARATAPEVELLVRVAPDCRSGAEESLLAQLAGLLSGGEPSGPADLTPGDPHNLPTGRREAATVSVARVSAAWAHEAAVAQPAGRLGPPAAADPAGTTAVFPPAERQTPAPPGSRTFSRIDDPDCPYPGLSAFDDTREKYFRGRGALVGQALELLRQRAGGGDGPLVLVGASGSGKSSVLRAGILPAVARGALGTVMPPGSVRVVLTPTEHPLAELASRIADALSVPGLRAVLADTLRTAPEHAPGVVSEILAGLAPPAPGRRTAAPPRLLLAVDQFEEVFTLCADEAEREAFVRALCALSTAPAPAVVVLAVRGDFYLECAAYPALAEPLQDGQIVVGPMRRSELLEAITGPARAVGAEVEPALVDLLLDDLAAASGQAPAPTTADPASAAPSAGAEAGLAETGALPLLAHALRVTWDHRVDGTLLVRAYRDAGRLAGALAKTADDLYLQLGETGQQAAHELLLRLVRLGRGGPTRRPLRRDDLLGEVDLGRADAEPVLDRLIAARLLEADAERVRIAHEALLWAWPRLRDWIELDRAGGLVRQQLDDAAREWETHGHDPSFLLSGPPLAAAEDWIVAGGRRRGLSAPARAFYDASRAREQARAAAVRRRTRRLVGLATGLAVLSVLATVLAVVTFDQRSSTISARDRAQSQRLAGLAGDQRLTRPELATHLALQADRVAGTAESRSAILASNPSTTLRGVHTAPIGTVAYSLDGKLVASGSDDATAALWDGARPGRGLISHLPRYVGPDGRQYAVKAVAFSRTGRTLAAGMADGATQLWDITDPRRPALRGELPRAVAGRRTGVHGLAFSPTADVLAVGGYGTTVRLFDVTDPAAPRALGMLGPAGGSGAAAAGPAHTAPVRDVEFSPDGARVVTGGLDGRAVLWTLADGASAARVVAELPWPDEPLIGPALQAARLVDTPVPVAFSRDENAVYYGCSAFLCRSDLDGAEGAPTFRQYASFEATKIHDIVSLPDGWVAVVSDLARLSLVNPVWGLREQAYGALENHGWALAARPDGPEIVIGADDPGLHVRSGAGVMVNDGREGIDAVAAGLAANGTDTLVFLGGDSNVMVYRSDPSGQHATTLLGWIHNAHPFHASAADIARGRGSLTTRGIEFRASDQVLITASSEGIRLWDASEAALAGWSREPLRGADVLLHGYPRPPARPTPLASVAADTRPAGDDTARVASIDLSPDGSRLVVGDNRGGITVWDVSDPRRPARIASRQDAHPGSGYVIAAFGADGGLVASAGADGLIRLWRTVDLAAGPLGEARYDGTPEVVEFAPHAPLLAVGGSNPQVQLLEVSDASTLTAVGTTDPASGGIFGLRFNADGTRLLVSGGDLKLWNVAAHHRADPELVANLPGSGRTPVFSPDGQYALTAGGNDAVSVGWLPTQADRFTAQLCEWIGDPVPAEEWARFLPDVANRDPCAD